MTAQLSDTARRRPITTVEEAQAWLGDCLEAIGGGFHPDTPGADYVNAAGPTFTRGQARQFDRNRAKADDVLSEAGVDIYAVTGALDQARRYADASDDGVPVAVVAALRLYHAARGGPDASEALLDLLDVWLGKP